MIFQFIKEHYNNTYNDITYNNFTYKDITYNNFTYNGITYNIIKCKITYMFLATALSKAN